MYGLELESECEMHLEYSEGPFLPVIWIVIRILNEGAIPLPKILGFILQEQRSNKGRIWRGPLEWVDDGGHHTEGKRLGATW